MKEGSELSRSQSEMHGEMIHQGKNKGCTLTSDAPKLGTEEREVSISHPLKKGHHQERKISDVKQLARDVHDIDLFQNESRQLLKHKITGEQMG